MRTGKMSTTFHLCHCYYGEDGIFRKKVKNPDPFAQLSFEHYKGQAFAKQMDLDAFEGTSAFHGRIKDYTQMGASIFNLDIPGVVGVVGLFLCGKISVIEQKYCIKFQQLIGSVNNCQLPMSPLEIEGRPLLYCVLFNLEEDHSGLYKSSSPELLSWVHGLGLAMAQTIL